jgi:hypothetical protein
MRIKIGGNKRVGDLGGLMRGFFNFLLRPLLDLGRLRAYPVFDVLCSISMDRRMVDGKFLTFSSRSSRDLFISHHVYRCGMPLMTDLCVRAIPFTPPLLVI